MPLKYYTNNQATFTHFHARRYRNKMYYYSIINTQCVFDPGKVHFVQMQLMKHTKSNDVAIFSYVHWHSLISHIYGFEYTTLVFIVLYGQQTKAQSYICMI